MSPIAYWLVAAVLCLAGFVTIFSIGMPLLLTGAAMLIASPWRARRGVLGATVTGVWAFAAAYALVAPLRCSSSARGRAGQTIETGTTCSNLLGIDYSGGGSYRPPLLPALLVGLAVGVVATMAVWRILRRRSATGA